MTPSSKGKTGLVRPTALAALTAARGFTSHVRKHFHERYAKRYAQARAIFIFDVALLVLALSLLVLNIGLFGQFFQPRIGLDLSLRYGDVVAATLTPLEAIVRSTDGNTHEDVTMTWELPPGAEIVRAEPPLVRGTVALGRIVPGDEAVSRIYVRVRDLPGTTIPFGFVVRDGAGQNRQRLSGSEKILVSASAISAKPVLPVRAVEPGGSVPIAIHNGGTLTNPAIIIRLVTKDGAPASTFGSTDEVAIGDLAPGETRVVFLDTDPKPSKRLEFVWEVQDAGRAIVSQPLNIDAAKALRITLTTPLRSTPGAGSTDISYTSTSSARLWVYHPLQTTTTRDVGRSYDLSAGEGKVHIPLRSEMRTDQTNWWVIPYIQKDDGVVLGQRVSGALATAFSFKAEARYYSVLGDQLGIGPLPPRVGETTSYWIVWSVGPTDADLKDVALSAQLGANVRATGRTASLTPGDFQTDGSAVSWTIPSLPATGDAPATFAFEVELKPSASQQDTVPRLLSASQASAVEVRSNLELLSQDESLDANLVDDIQARGQGTVE